MFCRPKPLSIGVGQESVWSYPRPPRLETVSKRLQVVLNGVTIAETSNGFRVLETSHPPTYYFPPDDVRKQHLRFVATGSVCEWKGGAASFDVIVGDRVAARAAWCYPAPTSAFAPIKGFVAFYARSMDACYVEGERVAPQPGRFYGGWITEDVIGPFKGEPGTGGW